MFPGDNLYAIAVEGLSSEESLRPGQDAEDIADLTLFFGSNATFLGCKRCQVLQFKYKADQGPVSAAYLKKTIGKFAKSLIGYDKQVAPKTVDSKLSFGFVTNAEFSDGLWEAIKHLKAGTKPDPKDKIAAGQHENLQDWTKKAGSTAERLFPMIEFRAAERNLPTQRVELRRSLTDWSAGSDGQAKGRLLDLINLIQGKAGLEGQGKNLIRKQDVLVALNCDEDQLFPARTRFAPVGDVVEREALGEVEALIAGSSRPIFIDADGGVGKTVFVEGLASRMSGDYEVALFDCFGGGIYRSETQARHLPKFGLVQIVNEFASKGLCDPLLPSDSDSISILTATRKRLEQAAGTLKTQSSKKGVLVFVDAADNAQVEADRRHQDSFPRLLLASLSEQPIAGVTLVVTARPHRMPGVVGSSRITRFTLPVFSEVEARTFVKARKPDAVNDDIVRALARSGRNARVLSYLVGTWEKNVSGSAPADLLTATELIAQQCADVVANLGKVGWLEGEVAEFFTALAWLPPPIPLEELSTALGWQHSQVASAASDLAPMLEIVPQGAIFRDEPTETYISENYGSDPACQQAIAGRFASAQATSEYAAEVLPSLLVGIGDADTAFQLADSNSFPASIQSEYSRRRLRLARLRAAFQLSLARGDKDRVLKLLTRLSQVASANARGDDFIARSPGLAVRLGDRDVPRRLFTDRSGWRGARDARLTLAHTFRGELEEAQLHSKHTVSWINWHWETQDIEATWHNRHDGPEVFDFAAVLLISLVRGRYEELDRNLDLLSIDVGLSAARELLTVAGQYDLLCGENALAQFEEFVAGDKCKSLAVKLVLLARASHQRHDAASKLAATLAVVKPRPQRNAEENGPEEAVASAAFSALFYGSRAAAKRVLSGAVKTRPSAHDFGEHYGVSRIWAPLLLSCLRAWADGRSVRHSDLLPREIKIGAKAKAIKDDSELSKFLGSLQVPDNDQKRQAELAKYRSKRKPGRSRKLMRAQFSDRARTEIRDGIKLVLDLIAPLEKYLLDEKPSIKPRAVSSFLDVWVSNLHALAPHVLERPIEYLARVVGLRVLTLILRHGSPIDAGLAARIVEILTKFRFFVSEKISVLELFAEMPDLSDVSGDFAKAISLAIRSNEQIDQRGRDYGDLAASLLPVSVDEAKAYYRRGLAELDQIGADDYDVIYAMLHFAGRQKGGFINEELAHRFMNLTQTISSNDSSKFGWTLFGRVAGRSLGRSAIYKLLRWDEQDVAEYSYGLPQAACFLAEEGALDPRRAALLLLVSSEHGWWDWSIGKGLAQLFGKATDADRRAIFVAIFDKLKREHPGGGWPALWEGLLELAPMFPGVISPGELSEIQGLLERARTERDESNERRNPSWKSDGFARVVDPSEADADALVEELASSVDPTSTADLDRAMVTIEPLRRIGKKQFLELVREKCPYPKRLGHMLALCEMTTLDIQQTYYRLEEAMAAWKSSTIHLESEAKTFVERFLGFKASQLLGMGLAGSLDREIDRLSAFCGDREFVLGAILKSVAASDDEPSGKEWLELATSLVDEASPAATREALEDMLASPAARMADDIGEGMFEPRFSGSGSEEGFISSIFWYLLGHTDSYRRWSAAKAVSSMAVLGLVEDLKELLTRFDEQAVAPLTTKGFPLSFQNSQQWLLMGLARASLKHGALLLPLKEQLEALARRSDIHIVDKLQIARVLSNFPGGKSDPLASKLSKELNSPPNGFMAKAGTRSGGPAKSIFRFDYEFNKNEIEAFARLFQISQGEATDAVAGQITERFPGAADMSFFGGGERYHADRYDRHEYYREHIQRHALIAAVTATLQVKPVMTYPFEVGDITPYQEWLNRYDLTFKDGSFLADHKDEVPRCAGLYLLDKTKRSEMVLSSHENLLGNVGLLDSQEVEFPIYASFTSPDGVSVRIATGLIKARGAVGVCAKFARLPEHDFWMPMFDQGGEDDPYRDSSPFNPLIWAPDSYGMGVDQGDELATDDVASRPRLGPHWANKWNLTPDGEVRVWSAGAKGPVLRSQVWGGWQADPDDYRARGKRQGSILWADRSWLLGAAATLKLMPVQIVQFSKHRYSRYEDSKAVKAAYVLLHVPQADVRVWPGTKASYTA